MSITNLNDYQTFVFDCDGVILNSNKIKTDSFREVLSPFGNIAAEKLIKYHVENGGVSRYAKFRYFLDEIYPKFCKSITKPNFDDLINNYGDFCLESLFHSEVTSDLIRLKKNFSKLHWMIVSGGD